MDYKAYIAQKLNIDGMSTEEIASAIAVPPDSTMGDYALPCFKFAKLMRKSPVMIADALKSDFVCDDVISEVSAVNGYLNFRINKAGLAKDVLARIGAEGEKYGSSDMGAGRVICIDYSSINIAKPFHIGHLSTTVLGGALYRIYNFLGYKAVGINHLGDYGTQFGKLISAYKKWGNREEVEKGGIHAINDLYVRFNNEADEAMEAEAREYFRLIENGDKEANDLFDWFKSLTLAYVQTIYERLHIKFDSYAGERFYTDKMAPVVEELREKGLLKESNGAQIVDLEPYGMPPCLILRSDGASLYATRDLAAAIYRKKTYDFYKCLYVVAYQQNLHFKQFFKEGPGARRLRHGLPGGRLHVHAQGQGRLAGGRAHPLRREGARHSGGEKSRPGEQGQGRRDRRRGRGHVRRAVQQQDQGHHFLLRQGAQL